MRLKASNDARFSNDFFLGLWNANERGTGGRATPEVRIIGIVLIPIAYRHTKTRRQVSITVLISNRNKHSHGQFRAFCSADLRIIQLTWISISQRKEHDAYVGDAPSLCSFFAMEVRIHMRFDAFIATNDSYVQCILKFKASAIVLLLYWYPFVPM